MFVLTEVWENTCNFYDVATGDSNNIQGIHQSLRRSRRKTFSPNENDKSAKCVQWSAVLEAALWPPLSFTWDMVARVHNEIMDRYWGHI